ncbi:MAG: PEP-CTERM sorting domain-containing protein [Porticoccus sp.]|nr:PEP-CTERM sorting domain-containing protein [Porticoccus sp.]|tara:strand:+ start:284 stop:850 length:567 start_codon:yes stop_codon:yes gene_type:complete
MKKFYLLTCVLTFLFAGSVNAAPITLDFDRDLNDNVLSNGQLLNDVYSGLGVTFNASAAIRVGGGGVTSLPNLAAGSASDFSTDLELIFDTYATSVGASNVTNSVWVLTVFDELNSVIGLVNSVSFPGSALLSGIGNIKRAVFSGTQFGIDDLVFDTNASASVPEPLSLALLGLGLAGIGFTRKKKAI